VSIPVNGAPGENSMRILALPTRDEGDEIAAAMLGHFLNHAQYRLDTISALPINEVLREISDRRPDIICISALPPRSVGPARTAYRKIKAVLPGARVIVGIWRFAETPRAAHQRIGLSDQDKLVTTLADAASQIHVFCDRLPWNTP
jgi:hypothetical protein